MIFVGLYYTNAYIYKFIRTDTLIKEDALFTLILKEVTTDEKSVVSDKLNKIKEKMNKKKSSIMVKVKLSRSVKNRTNYRSSSL